MFYIFREEPLSAKREENFCKGKEESLMTSTIEEEEEEDNRKNYGGEKMQKIEKE